MSENEFEHGFAITDGHGFHLTFKNGSTVSVQFGFGNYCDNRAKEETSRPSKKFRRVESFNAEIAAWDKDDNWITKRYKDSGDDVLGYRTVEDVVEFIKWVKEFDQKSIIKNTDV